MKQKLTLLLIALVTTMGAWADDGTVVATMSDLVTGAGFNNAKTVKENSIYSCSYNTYIGAINNSAVTSAYEGSGFVTIAMWIWGNSASGCLFSYGDQGTGVKYYINGTTVKTTTKGVKDFDSTDLESSRIVANQWNLIAFTIPAIGGTWNTNNARYYATATDANFWTKQSGTVMNTPASDGKKCAIGSGNQGNAREAFNGIIANVTVIQSTNLLNNSRIAALVGSAPSSPVWCKPAMGGRTWTWNTTNNKYDSSDGTTATTTPGRADSKGPVYRFSSVGTVSATSDANTDTSDKGGTWVLGTQQNPSNVSVNIGRWAGSIDVETWQVANITYSQQLKNTEPSFCSSVWVDGDLTFGSLSSYNIDGGGDHQRWYIGENGIIHSSFTSVSKNSKEWNFQIVVANDPQVGETDTRIVHTRTRKVMTWGADIHSNIDNVKVFHKGDDGTLTEKNTTNDTNFEVTYDANGMYVTYTCKGYFNTNDPNYTYTYSSGVGTSESRVYINHNGGTVNLTGAEETHYLTGSNTATQTTVNFDGTTVNYSNELGIGSATYNIHNTSVTTPKFITSQGGAGRSAVVNLTGNTVITVTGDSNVDTNQSSIMIGHWNGSSNLTLSGTAQIVAADAQLLVGKTSNTQTITLNGTSNITAKGINVSSGASGTNTLNLNGGSLTLGDVGITSYSTSRSIAVNVNENSTITSTAETMPISQPITVASGKTLTIDGNETAAVTLTSTLTNNGTIILKDAALGGSQRITTGGVFTIKDLIGNELTAGSNNYALVGSGTLNFEGTCDLTKKSDGTTSNDYARIGYGSDAQINIKEDANVTARAIFNSQTNDGSNNATIIVESGATLTTTEEIRSVGTTNNGTISTTKFYGPVTLGDGTTNLSDATPFNGGAVTVSGDATLNLTATTATLNQAITVDADKTLDIDGKTNTVVLTGAVTNNGTINFKNATLTANLDDRSLTNYTFTSCTATVQFVETGTEYAAGGFTITDIPSGVTVKVKKYGTTEYVTETPVDGTVTIAHSVEVSGTAAWLDYTFNETTLATNQPATPIGNVPNRGNAGSGHTLTIDNSQTSAVSYNADGTFKVRYTPYRGMTWPENYTVAVSGNFPDVENGCLVAFGTKSGNYLALIRGANSNEIKLVKGQGNNTYTNIQTMAAENATAAAHLVVFTKQGNVFKVYCDGVNVATTTYDQTLGGGLQVGSIHGGYANTGVVSVMDNSLTDDQKNAVFCNAIRVYDYIISDTQMEALKSDFPYVSQGGNYTRTISEDADLDAEDAWYNVGEETNTNLPTNKVVEEVTYYPDIVITTTAASTLTVDANMDSRNIEFKGTNTLTIVSDGTHSISIKGSVTVNSPISVQYGGADLSAVPVSIGESGSIEFDFSEYDFSGVTTSTDYPVTGNTSDYGGKVTGVYPSDDYHTYSLAFNSTTNSYYLTVGPTVKLKQEMAIDLVKPYYNEGKVGTAIGRYTIKLGETSYANMKDFGDAVTAWLSLGDCVEPTITLNTPSAGFYRLKNVATNGYLRTITATNDYTSTVRGVKADGTATEASTVIKLELYNSQLYMYNQGYEFGWTTTDGTYSSGGVGYARDSAYDKYVNWFPSNITAGGRIAFAICLGNGTGDYASYLTKGIYTADTSDDTVIAGTDYTANAAQWIVEEATSVTVSLNSDGADSPTYYATFCAPFSYTVSTSGVTAYTLEESGDWLIPTAVEGEVAAGTPVLLKGTSASATLTIGTGYQNTNPLGTTALTGTYLAKTIDGATDYVLGIDGGVVGFYHWDSNNLAANRAYVDTPAGVKGFVLKFDDDPDAIKTLFDSPLKGENIYNLAGQRISKMQKGINIVNGKKILK